MVQSRAWIVFFLVSIAGTNPAFAQNDAPEEPRTWVLQDDSIIQGTLIEETPEDYLVNTAFGEVRVNKADMKKTNVRLYLRDGSTVAGVLLEETKEAYRIDSKMGVLTIAKAHVTSFEVNEGKKKKPAAKEVAGILVAPAKAPKEESFSHAIEPMIDIFFDPTGYTFGKGDIYFSGLSIGYGLSDDWLISMNVPRLVGIMDFGKVNPNLELKYNLYESRKKDTETFIAVGMRGEVMGHIGNTEILYFEERMYWCSGAHNENRPEINRKTVRKWKGHYNWEDYEDYEDYEDFENYRMSQVNPSGPEGCESGFSREYEEEWGWSTQLYLATTFSRLMDRGGRMSLHVGGSVEMNALHTRADWKWTEHPSFRLYSAFDLDVSRNFKLLGEFFYDPDHFNPINNLPRVGVDVGLLWTYSETLRFLVHLDIPFVGIYWRF